MCEKCKKKPAVFTCKRTDRNWGAEREYCAGCAAEAFGKYQVEMRVKERRKK